MVLEFVVEMDLVAAFGFTLFCLEAAMVTLDFLPETFTSAPVTFLVFTLESVLPLVADFALVFLAWVFTDSAFAGLDLEGAPGFACLALLLDVFLAMVS